ncbi:MAG TPA: hypothetical protein VLZ30_10515, partial [Verrucomicrobiae bacterium]|nr:hypothetical protein [Verrucomicrobiae bacterium]
TVAVGAPTEYGDTGSGTMIVSNGTWIGEDFDIEAGGTLTIAGGTAILKPYEGCFANGCLTVAGGTTTILPYRNTSTAFLAVGTYGTGSVWIVGGPLTLPSNGLTQVGAASFFAPGFGQITISNGTWECASVQLVPDAMDGPSSAETGMGVLTIAGGMSEVWSNLTVGNAACIGTSVVSVTGGALFVTNATHNAVLDIGGGTFTFSSGLVVVDQLVMTNECGRFIHTGGTLVISSTNMLADASAAGDELPNYWKLRYGFDLFDPTVGVQDPDDDGLINYVEYLAGTDPLDSSDPFRVTAVSVNGSDFHIDWRCLTPPGSPFAHCLVESSPTVTGAWSSVSGTLTVPTGDFNIVRTNFVDFGGATNGPSRYYRVRLVP